VTESLHNTQAIPPGKLQTIQRLTNEILQLEGIIARKDAGGKLQSLEDVHSVTEIEQRLLSTCTPEQQCIYKLGQELHDLVREAKTAGIPIDPFLQRVLDTNLLKMNLTDLGKMINDAERAIRVKALPGVPSRSLLKTAGIEYAVMRNNKGQATESEKLVANLAKNLERLQLRYEGLLAREQPDEAVWRNGVRLYRAQKAKDHADLIGQLEQMILTKPKEWTKAFPSFSDPNIPHFNRWFDIALAGPNVMIRIPKSDLGEVLPKDSDAFAYKLEMLCAKHPSAQYALPYEDYFIPILDHVKNLSGTSGFRLRSSLPHLSAKEKCEVFRPLARYYHLVHSRTLDAQGIATPLLRNVTTSGTYHADPFEHIYHKDPQTLKERFKSEHIDGWAKRLNREIDQALEDLSHQKIRPEFKPPQPDYRKVDQEGFHLLEQPPQLDADLQAILDKQNK